jgi:hypothetical protein
MMQDTMSQPERPRLIVVAGPNGAGKTSITEQLLRHEWMGGCEYVNPDLIARDTYGDWNAPDAVLQAARQAAEIRETCLSERRNLAFETVLSMPDKLDFIRRAQAKGFFVRLFCKRLANYIFRPPGRRGEDRPWCNRPRGRACRKVESNADDRMPSGGLWCRPLRPVTRACGCSVPSKA